MFFPAWLGKIFELLGFVFLFDLSRVPRRYDVDQIGRDPGCTFELFGICRRFGIKPFQKESLALNPHHGVQQRLEYIGDHLATSRLGNDPSSQLVGCGIDVIDFDAWKSFFEGRKNR